MQTHKDMKRAYKDPARCKEMWRKWYAANREQVCARKRSKAPRVVRVRQSEETYRTKALVRSRESKYGVSAERYADMHESQKGLCAICGKPETAKSRYSGKVRSLNVDHSHRTGKVRDLLCVLCNAALGHTRESVSTLRRMIDYLEKHNG